MVTIDVLGPFAAATEAGPILFEARSAAALVAFVALARGRPLARDAASAALWPDHDSVSARTNLRKALQRVRKATPEGDLIMTDGDALLLGKAETDLDRADRFHRTFLLATRQPEGTAALTKEWALRSRSLLDGWNDEWILPHRQRAAVNAVDLGIDLARSEEATGDFEAALVTWREILAQVPHHAQALQSALRLESVLHGTEHAADLARHARLYFRDELGVAMPQELQQAVRDYGMGALEPVPPPESLRKRSELYLLARLFESNLEANRTEALELLARECTVARALAHPRAMLSLMTLALEKTVGASPERLAVAATAANVASWTSEFDVGYRWCDFVLESTEPTDVRHAPMLALKGFMIGEQGDFETSRDMIARSCRLIDALGPSDIAIREAVRHAGPYWHLLEFDTSIGMYEAVIERCGPRNDGAARGFRAACHGNLCFVYSVLGRWDECLVHGRESLRLAEDLPHYTWIVSAPLGLAACEAGDRIEGLRMIRRSLANTLREGMSRFNQICLDYAAVALARLGRERSARCLLDANIPHLAALRRCRSRAESRLVVGVAGIDPDAPYEGENPLRGQSAATLSEWACEELDRLIVQEGASSSL